MTPPELLSLLDQLERSEAALLTWGYVDSGFTEHEVKSKVQDLFGLDELEAEDRIVFRYLDNPNGSLRDIAGVCSEGRNVMGMMPHPERASDALLGSTDGRVVLESMVRSLVAAHA